MYRWYLVDVPILASSLEFDNEFNLPERPLVVSMTGRQQMDNGEKRTYYAANPPVLLLMVFRYGLKVEDITNMDRTIGQVFLKTRIGWDDGVHGFTSQQGTGQRHSKMTVEMILHAPPVTFAEDFEPLSAFIARCPQAVRSVGRPAVGDELTEAHSITLPADMWRRVERLGRGNRSAGVRQAIARSDR